MKKQLSIILSVCLILTAIMLAPLSASAASAYYLVGNFNGWSVSDSYKLELHSSFDGATEYRVTVDLYAGDELKVLSSNGTWYPGGTDNNCRVSSDGNYKVFFRPNYDGNGGWHYSTIYLQKLGPITAPDPTDPTEPDEPAEPYDPDRPLEKVLLGDADGSGCVNVYDASYIVKGITGTTGYPAYSRLSRYDRALLTADVDDSGIVNVMDAAFVMRHITGDESAIALGIGTEVEK